MVRDFSPEELSYMATSFAVAITKELDNEQIKVMCNFFVSVVGTLNLILGQRHLCCDNHDHHCRDGKYENHEKEEGKDRPNKDGAAK